MRCARCGSENQPNAKFCVECGSQLARGVSESAAERRQLTVLFLDLVGSTTLSQQLDAEQLHDLYTEYRSACAEVIDRYDGHIAQYLGDGILVYFGYPTAHEDDALRAVSTALDALNRVRSLSVHGQTPQVRAAVHTGLVVVGEVGTTGHRERLATGQAPNIASHMQGRAEPGTAVISEATKRLVAGHFAFGDLGQHVLKGVSEPMKLYQVLGRSEATSRFAAKAAIGLAPFVGREEEVRTIEGAWERAAEGEGQTLLFRGEAGIGKSRLLGVARDTTMDRAHEVFEVECSPYHMNSPFHPIGEMLGRRAGLTDDQAPLEKLERLEGLVSGRGVEVAEAMPYVAEMMSIPVNGRYRAIEMPPPKRRQRILDILAQMLLRSPVEQPLVLLIEDLHWADPSTLELVRALVERQADAPLFMVCTSRPEGVTLPTTLGHCAEIDIEPLPEREAGALVAAVAGAKALPAEVSDAIISRTGGVPLFIEAVIDTVLEAGVLRETPYGYEMTGPLPEGLIPATVHDSLTARIDRLGPDKPLAQLAATIGREFEFRLLQAVSGRDTEDLEEALDRIVEIGLLSRSGAPPTARYTFKHALIQDAAYDSLLRRTRVEYHKSIADALSEGFQEIVDSEPELLARHFELSGRLEEATDYWLKAADQATTRWAEEESVRYLRSAIALLERRPADDPERLEKEMGAQLALGPLLMATRGWGSPEVETACSRARDLCQQAGNGQGLLTALWGLWTVRFVRGEIDPALEAADPVLEMALATDNPVLQIAGRHAVGFTRYFMGDFEAAREHGERAKDLFDLDLERALVEVFQLSSSVACGVFHAQSLWFMGYPEQAEARHAEAWSIVEALDHAPTTAYGLGVCMFLHYAKRDRDTIAAWAERLHTLCTEEGFLLWSAQARIYRGWAQSLAGDPEAGLEEMEAGLDEYRQTQSGIMMPQLLLMLAEALWSAGRATDALAELGRAMTTAERWNERAYEPELHRLTGEILLDRGKTSAGEQALRRSMEVAAGQGAKMLELRAALALARHLSEARQPFEAAALLQPICEWFEEGHATPELVEARELLGRWRA